MPLYIVKVHIFYILIKPRGPPPVKAARLNFNKCKRPRLHYK
jgi:hypothetical protein